MTTVRITFYNTTPHVVSEYTIYRSNTVKKVFSKTYNTTNPNRAMSYARRFIRKQDKDLGNNTLIELF